MKPWDDPEFADLKRVAEQLEAAVRAANDVLLKAAGITADGVVEAFAKRQEAMLRFDKHTSSKFRQALEDKRVTTLSQGNIFVACVLTSAVALSEFKVQPIRADGGFVARRLDRMRQISTNGLSLGAFAYASFTALLGKNAIKHLQDLRSARKSLAPPP